MRTRVCISKLLMSLHSRSDEQWSVENLNLLNYPATEKQAPLPRDKRAGFHKRVMCEVKEGARGSLIRATKQIQLATQQTRLSSRYHPLTRRSALIGPSWSRDPSRAGHARAPGHVITISWVTRVLYRPIHVLAHGVTWSRVARTWLLAWLITAIKS